MPIKQQQQMSSQQRVVKQSTSVQQQSSSFSMQQSSVQQQSQTQTSVRTQVQQGTQRVQGPTQMVPVGLPAGASPPVFEQIFQNARFAQGGDALFEGKVQGSPKPTVTWTRRGQQISSGNKYEVSHDEVSGVVTLLIRAIGPGDEGEYTCTAANQYGEAICTVYIQPEAAYMMQQQRQQMQQSSVQSQMHIQKQQQMSLMQNGYSESFRVDTFEHRILHEVEFRQSLCMRLEGEVEMGGVTIQGPPTAPQLQQKPRSTKVADGGNATFTVNLHANPSPRVIWFKNGSRLQQSEKFLMTASAGQATLVIKNVNSSDNGYYTMVAENRSGCTVASAQLAVVPKGEDVTNGHHVPEVIRPTSAVEPMEIETDESGKTLEPKFVLVPRDRESQEGKMVRFDCRVTGRPYPEVTWFLNGQTIADDATHKVLVNEAGNHSLMITEVSLMDNGTITCVARNKSGEATFQVALHVLEREQIVSPKFVERFQQGQVKEGETVVLHARAVGTPMPSMSWQKDGVTIDNSASMQIQSDGQGSSNLQILSASVADAGWYSCNASNVAGSTSTRARLHVVADKNAPAMPQRPHFPKPTTVIQPQPEPAPEIINLRPVERAHHQPRAPEEERPTEPPMFTVPLRDIDLEEGKRAHFEAKLTPVGDATMNVEWLLDGRPLAASSRATTTYRFGYVALDILNVIKADTGVYTCRASNVMGQAEVSANLRITEKPVIDTSSQHTDAMKQMNYMEQQATYQKNVSIEEAINIKPNFVKSLANLGEVSEGKYAHFEAQLHPVSDPFMRIEWFKDGKTITASSRINVIYNFGYVALNIMHLRPEDSGTYSVRATNKAGECTCSATIKVIAIGNVTGDLGIPEQSSYIKSVEEMEAYRLKMLQKQTTEFVQSTQAPVFKSELKDTSAREGGYAHFEARLEPIGDPSLKVEWLKDGRPLEASARITAFYNFGYVALTIKQLIIQDAGTYTCVATNTLGKSQVKCTLVVISKTEKEVESHYSETVQKMEYMEDSSRYQRNETEETTVTIAPKFVGQMKGTNKIVEGQKAHFEVRLEPQSDSTMTVEWYFNSTVIMSASRIKLYNDFGYVSLDISDVRSSDSGTYTVVARNALGEAQLSTQMIVETRSGIDYSTMHEVTMSKTTAMERRAHQEPQYDIDEHTKAKPTFTVLLADPKPVSEGKNIHLEARLEPVGDPTMRVEWFFNGKPLTVGSRFKTYFDFGFVALDILSVYANDTGEYTCRAENALGSAHTSAQVQVLGTSYIESETMHGEAMEQISYLENARNQRGGQEETEINQAPTFAKSLKNIETIEGTNIHLEARLQPVGDSSMRIEWFFNDEPLKVGHRFRPAYDFDYVALDLLSVYPYDSGIYTCRATNKLGQAVSSASVKITAKKDLVFDSEHPDSLQKLQYLDDASRYHRRETLDEVSVKIKPKFLTQLKDLTLKEGQSAHFEAKIEPITDPNLRVEWYKNGQPITMGSRFRTIHDFGYVALDIGQLIEEDAGVYTCVATNLLGTEKIQANLNCMKATGVVITNEQTTLTMEQLTMLESRNRHSRTEIIEETTKQAPVFTTALKNLEILEGQRAHFEVRLIPTSDPTMKIEWFHDNKPIKSGSRFTEYNDFGFVALDIMYAYAEDSGTYTCVATNCLGQATSTCTLLCHTKESILVDTMNAEAMSKISQLETRTTRTVTSEEMVMQAPVFTAPMRDQNLIENAPLHFEARLIPVGDPDLKVEWFKNGVPIQQANRITTMHDFGYVALDMKYVNPEDSGTYTCRATNRLGQAVTSATLVVTSKESLLMESQHSEALEKLRFLEDSSRYSKTTTEETMVTTAPRFTVQLSGLTQLWEGQSAHVECRLEPYPDSSMKVEWFHNGKPLNIGHRFRTMYDFGFCAMDILSAVAEDSGTYEVRATNRIGTASSSITIEIKAKSDFIVDTQHPEAMSKIARLEQKAPLMSPDDVQMIEKPNFGRPLRNQENLIEGQAMHMEATLTPVNDATMKVEWFFNGKPIPSGHRFRTTYDFGFVALDVLYAYPEDSGTYMCKATNAAGQAVTSCTVKITEVDGMQVQGDEERMRKIKALEASGERREEMSDLPLQKPVFTTPLQNQDNIVEGDRVHLECRLEPINDPNLRVEWYVNGVEIKAGHRFRTTHDFGYVALDVLYAYAEDSGTYLCKATNKLGEAVNSCCVTISARRSIYLDTQHPDGWQKIQSLESRGRYERMEVADLPEQPPRFTSELRGNTQAGEMQKVHLEGRIEPVHDPSMRVEWYHNGVVLQSAARFHTTFDFGYVALDITTVYESDSGEYTCKAFNHKGEAVSSISITVEGKEGIIYQSARPEGLDKIRELEDRSKYARTFSDDNRTFQRPVFTQPLQNLDRLQESETAHFECRLIPVGDPNLKVEWYRNETLIETSSRINRTHDFGYVALDISGIRADDEGIYMCRAHNELGEAVTTASMKIRGLSTILTDTQHPEGMRKIEALEARKHQDRIDGAEKVYDKPVFTAHLVGPAQVMEGQSIHFECRVVPVGDVNLRYEWFCNSTELKTGSRFITKADFGYVTLDINKAIAEDSGIYMCKAYNLAGEAISSCTTKVIAKDSVLGDSLHPEGYEQIRLRETQWNRVPQTPTSPDAQEPPMFTKHLESNEKLQEGGFVHLEAQVQPAHDPNLSIEWYKNGIQLTTGSRVRSTFDFGHVTLDISGLRPDDSGIYTCRAVNRVGEAVSTCTVKVFDRDWLIGESVRPEALSKIAHLEAPRAGPQSPGEPDYQGPAFITHLNNVECHESDTAHFECRVEPAKDPTMKIEWFINGKPLQAAARYHTTYDFGYVSLDCTHCYGEDSGMYMCRATNSKGSATTTGTLRCTSKASLYFDTQHPQGRAGLENVEAAERAYWAKYQRQMSEKDVTYPKPFFIRPLQPNFSIIENQTLQMEANVEPKNDPDLKIEWFLNGKTLEQGSRFRTSYDFGLVSLALQDGYERDQGIYTCRAYNKAGEAWTTATVVIGGKDSIIDSSQHPAGAAGLEAIARLEESMRRGDRMLTDEEGHAPRFTTEFKSISNMEEGDIAHFEAMLIPVGDQTMKIEWFYKGQELKASHRVRTVYAFGMVVMEIIGTKVADCGEYTCRATNKWGTAECSFTFECVDRAHGQPPKFTTHIKNVEGLKDGDSAHFECTLIPIGDPNMKVEWFHNGEPLRNATRIKTVSDFGYVVMDIAYTQSHDSGEWVCRASNKYGEDYTKAFINCQGRGGVYTDSLQPGSLDRIAELEAQGKGARPALTPTEAMPPHFITQINTIDRLAEGQSAHFEARLKPVGDPNLIVEWYKDGKKLPTGHRFRTFHDFGIVILDILYCYEEDSGVYEARAVNKLGEDKTTANLSCSSKTGLILTPQVPKGMEGGLSKIQKMEDSAWMRRETTAAERVGMAPKFTVPLANIENLKEGENAHFEARLLPTDDPRLKVEWYWNGKPMKVSSRIRQFCDFGFVIMELSPVYPEDSGEYMCRAFNDYGEAVTKCTLKCEGKRSIILESQLPASMQKGMEKIAELEGLMIKSPELMSPDSGSAPQFITKPDDTIIMENQLAHFECRLMPVGDPNLRIEWYHNGRALSSGSRIKTIHDFGYVILEMANCYGRDSGTYTCRAVNKHGEASTECTLTVSSKSGIILEPQAHHQFKNVNESIQKLEESMWKREDIIVEDEKACPPRFISELENITELVEGQPAHFDCRVEPVGDATMRIEWFHNGMPLAAGSRVHMMDDFGFVVLDLEWTFARDSGEYLCRATNKWGTAMTKASLNIRTKHGIDVSTQLPQGMTAEKLKELERGPLMEKIETEMENTPPKFTCPISSFNIGENERAFFECRVEPRHDPNLRIEWYHNGRPLQSGSRYRTSFEMGHVSLELLQTVAEDSGEYTCRAVNKLGQDLTKASLKVAAGQTVVMHSQVPKGMQQMDFSQQMEQTLKKYCTEIMLTQEDIYDVAKRQPPRFVTHIKDQMGLKEMEGAKFDCQLAPVGDPNMKVEWFFNGRPLPYKNRFTPIYDFGYVALQMNWVFGEDSGEYLCRATNKYGMDETRANLKSTARPGVIYDSQLPVGKMSLDKIRELEAQWDKFPEAADEGDKPRSKPDILLKPENVNCQEGEWARFSVRVSGHPRPRVMWIVNGNTAMSGNRFKIWYDGIYHLDIPKTRQYDTGKIEVMCRNALGQAYAACELNVKPRMDDYRAVLKNSPKPWYDYELKSYQKDRQANELDRVYQERVESVDTEVSQESKFGDYVARSVDITEDTEWQKIAKQKNAGEKIKQLELDQKVKSKSKDVKQFAHPALHASEQSLAKGMASRYEQSLTVEGSQMTTEVTEEQVALYQQRQEQMIQERRRQEMMRTKRIEEKQRQHTEMHQQQQTQLKAQQELHMKQQQLTQQHMLQQQKIDEQKTQQTVREMEPAESAVHAKEIHTSTQKQTQKEVQGDLEIHRKITATERTEVEHTAKTTERIVSGDVKPAKPPYFTKKIQPCRAFERDGAKFEVEFDGEPMPTIQWYREDFPITSSPDFQIHTFGDKSILQIREVFMEDSGVFAVVAENRGGRAKCSANLVVEERRQSRAGLVPPSFIQTIQDVRSKPELLVRLDAKIYGTAPIDILWLKNGRKLTQDAHIKIIQEEDVYTLLILECVAEDSGKYECVAVNKAGEARCQADVSVAGPRPVSMIISPDTPSQVPSVVENLKPQVVVEGQSAVFECCVAALPPPHVQWLKDQQPIKHSKYFSMTSEGDIHTLNISECFPEDEGSYQCIISNSMGKITLEAPLQVVHPEVKEEIPALTPLQAVTVWEGEGCRFMTQVTGNPNPQVQWYREGAMIPHSRDFEMFMEGNTAVLDIKLTYPEDSGTFTCRATNAAGQAETSAMLTVQNRETSDKNVIRKEKEETRKNRWLSPSPARQTDGTEVLPKIKKISEEERQKRQKDFIWEKKGEDIGAAAQRLKPSNRKVSPKTKEKLQIPKVELKKGVQNKFKAKKAELESVDLKHNEELKKSHPNNIDNELSRNTVNGPYEPTQIPDKQSMELETPEYISSQEIIITQPRKEQNQNASVKVPENERDIQAPQVAPWRIKASQKESPKIDNKEKILEDLSISQKAEDNEQGKIENASPLKKIQLKPTKKLPNIKEPKQELEKVQLKPGKIRPKSPESKSETVELKSIPKNVKNVDQKEEHTLKSMKKVGKDTDFPEKVELKPVKRRQKLPEPQKDTIDLKPIPKPQRKMNEKEQTDLPYKSEVTPTVTNNTETEEFPITDSFSPEEDVQETTKVMQRPKPKENIHPQEEKTLPEKVQLKPNKRPKQVREPDNKMEKVELKSTRRFMKGKEEQKPEPISLKPVRDEQKGKDSISKTKYTELIPTQLAAEPEEQNGMDETKISKATLNLTEPNEPKEIKPKAKPLKRANQKPRDFDLIPPAFSMKLEPIVGEPNKNAIFIAEMRGYPNPDVKWYFNDVEIVPGGNKKMKRENKTVTLSISKATEEDEGMYTCEAINSAGKATCMANFKLQARRVEKPSGEPPRFVVPLAAISAQHGSKAVLEAQLRGQPKPKILWYHVDKEIPQSQEFLQEYNEINGRVSLSIREVYIDDKGLYRCLALNEHGRDETTTYVTVEDIELLEKSELRQAPQIILPLQPHIVPQGSSIDLHTTYEAFPPPTIKWYQHGKEIKPSRDFMIDTTKYNETSLHIEELFEDDSGEYEVRIFNEAGEARTTASVLITKPEEEIDLEPPKFTKLLIPQTVPEAEVAILEVQVTARPEADFTWYRHGQEITENPELEVQITSENNKSSLILGEVYDDDSGDYTVAAQNEVGRIACTATLLVEPAGEGEEEEDEESEAPVFNPTLTPIRVMDGEEVRFSCKVRGKPMPKISWFHNGRPIGHQREVRLTQTPEGRTGLYILEVFPEDAGDYTCIARNKAGEARTTANLTVESYEYRPESETGTITSTSDKQIFSGSVSEADTLENVKSDSSDSEDSEAGSCPYFCQQLEKRIEIKEGSSVRLLAKIVGYPRPEVKWYADGQPLGINEGRTIESYEDGTEALTLNSAFIDDCGEYTCEAMNRNGIDTTTTQLVVLPVTLNEHVSQMLIPNFILSHN
ncbi:unnamed protein product, partial [Meganyctiphanes norvegica]